MFHCSMKMKPFVSMTKYIYIVYIYIYIYIHIQRAGISLVFHSSLPRTVKCWINTLCPFPLAVSSPPALLRKDHAEGTANKATPHCTPSPTVTPPQKEVESPVASDSVVPVPRGSSDWDWLLSWATFFLVFIPFLLVSEL